MVPSSTIRVTASFLGVMLSVVLADTFVLAIFIGAFPVRLKSESRPAVG